MKSNQIVETPRRHLNPASVSLPKSRLAAEKLKSMEKSKIVKTPKTYTYMRVYVVFFSPFFLLSMCI